MVGLSDVDLDLGGGDDRTVVVIVMVVMDGGDDFLDFLGDGRGDVRGERGFLVVVTPARGEAEREKEEEEDDGGPHEDSDDYP